MFVALRQELKYKGMEVLIRGGSWNSSPEGCKIERFARCVLRTLVMQWIIRSLGLGMEGIAAQVYIFFQGCHFIRKVREMK